MTCSRKPCPDHFERSEILVQMQWIIIVLLPKMGGNYRDIGLIDSIHKTVQLVEDGRLEVIDFHDCLHGFLTGHGMVKAIVEMKLAM